MHQKPLALVARKDAIMKATIRRASAHTRNELPMLSVTFTVIDGDYAGTEGTVYHHPRAATEAQKTATRIFKEACPLERHHWGRTDLSVPCEVTRAVVDVDGKPTVEWQFAAAAAADASVLAMLY